MRPGRVRSPRGVDDRRQIVLHGHHRSAVRDVSGCTLEGAKVEIPREIIDSAPKWGPSDTDKRRGSKAKAFAGGFLLASALALLALLDPAWAQKAQHFPITSFAVGPDQTLTYPHSSSGTNQLAGFADLHTTFFPPAASGAPYVVFGAAETSRGVWGAVVLQTTD